MDVVTYAGAFATIVGLLHDYLSERRTVSHDEYKNFIHWLESKRHDQLLSLINSNLSISGNIKSLLNENTETVLQRLNSIDNVLAKLSSKVVGLSEIAKAVKPSQTLSDQAISILKQLHDLEGTFFVELKSAGSPSFVVWGTKGGDIRYKEPQFVEDDLRTLVDLGLLRLDYNDSRERLFYITRGAIVLLKTL